MRARHYLVPATATTHLHGLWSATELQSMKLRLVEQACAAGARCKAEAESRCVLFTASGTRVENASHRDPAPALIVFCNGATIHEAPTGGATQTCGCCMEDI